jgi:hypothetical protein
MTGMENATSTMENHVIFPQNLSIELLHDPEIPLLVYPRELK